MRLRWRSAVATAAALGVLIVSAGCAAKARPPEVEAVEAHAVEPRWEDVIDRTPELFLVVRPRALQKDKMYGALLRRAIELVRQQSRIVAATRALDALEDTDEVIAAMRSPSGGRAEELVIVARGVRADVDPGKLVDAEGHTLWAPGPAGPVRELLRDTHDEPGHPDDPAGSPPEIGGASLFELPGRTWVIASGEARARARDVLAHPTNRPAIDIDPEALAIVRIDGRSLVARVRPLAESGGLAAVGRRLEAATLVLPPGNDAALRATLAYEDEIAAGAAQASVEEAVAAIARSNGNAKAKREAGLAWLGTAKVDRVDKRVTITAPLPQPLMDALLKGASHPGAPQSPP